MPRVLLAVVAVAVIVFALVDCARTDEDRMPVRIPKALWILLILFLPVLGGAAWIVASRLARPVAGSPATRGGGSAGSFGPLGPTSRPPARPARNGPLAPDDDPDFLARLEADRRRREREKKEREARESGGGAGAADAAGGSDVGESDADGETPPKGGTATDDPRDSPSSPA
ncbi:putative membrane protein [Actinomycetales bacterium JB111]|nr:putative membrane protein [Actinomycetales bacterium JB111]